MPKAISTTNSKSQKPKEDVQSFAEEKLLDERGEMGSWLILAAGLVIAAVAVVGILGDFFEDKARFIEKKGNEVSMVDF